MNSLLINVVILTIDTATPGKLDIYNYLLNLLTKVFVHIYVENQT